MDLPPPLSSLEQVKERDGEEGKMNEGRSRDSSLLSRAVPRRRMEPERGRERETRTGGNAHRGERDPEKERKRKKKVCFCLLPPHLLRFLLFLEGTKHRWAWGRQLGGGSAKFWRGGEWFLDPQGGNKFRLSEGGKGGGNKRKNRKKNLIAAKKRQKFGNF